MEITKNKKNFGQFYTTNYDVIFQEMDLGIFTGSHVCIVEPFVGKGHLIEYIKSKKEEGSFTLECYDIDPKCDFVNGKRDTLLDPPSYKNKIVVTNPPYLAKNKCKDKVCFDKYNVNDLYKCFMETIIADPPLGGLIIIPLNFWCSIRDMDIQLRKRFLSKFNVHRVNVFEQSVFEDTSYTVCSILFEIKQTSGQASNGQASTGQASTGQASNGQASTGQASTGQASNGQASTGQASTGQASNGQASTGQASTGQASNGQASTGQASDIRMVFYPSKKDFIFSLDTKNNYTIGGEIYLLPMHKEYKISRLLAGQESSSSILLKALDDDGKKRICLSISESPYYGKATSRTYASINIDPPIGIDKQKEVVSRFNQWMEELRTKYNSMFLTNYRESKDISRKRISFDLAYQMIGYLLNDTITH